MRNPKNLVLLAALVGLGLACRSAEVVGSVFKPQTGVLGQTVTRGQNEPMVVAAFAATLVPTASPPGAWMGHTTDVLRVREEPGTGYLIVGNLPVGAEVEIAGRLDATWLRITAPVRGWIAAPYVELDNRTATLQDLPVVAPPPTPTPPPTATAVSPAAVPSAPAPTPYVQFYAEPPQFWYLGQCGNLWWNVDGVQAVYLSGVGVPGHGNMRVCPKSTTGYELHVVFRDGHFQDTWVSISVPQPPTQVIVVTITATPGPTPTPWIVTATPGPTQTPWVVTATPTPTNTPTPTSTARP